MPENPSVLRQRLVSADIRVIGVDDWRTCLNEMTELRDQYWRDRCGGAQVPLLTYLEQEALVNDVSFERCVVNTFLNRGYRLEELIIEFTDKSEWGRYTWHKEHPSYPKAFEPGSLPHDMKAETNFFAPVFATEHAGDQLGVIYRCRCS